MWISCYFLSSIVLWIVFCLYSIFSRFSRSFWYDFLQNLCWKRDLAFSTVICLSSSRKENWGQTWIYRNRVPVCELKVDNSSRLKGFKPFSTVVQDFGIWLKYTTWLTRKASVYCEEVIYWEWKQRPSKMMSRFGLISISLSNSQYSLPSLI